VSNEVVSGLDWLPTLLAAAGEPDIKDKLRQGHGVAGTTFRVHLGGYNQLPYLTGREPQGPRRELFYFNDDGDLVAFRYENWKIVFAEQRAPGQMRIWAEPFTPLRVPKLFDLRADPYERADVTSNTYYDWVMSQPFMFMGANAAVTTLLGTFKEFPPSQRPGTFGIDQALEVLKKASSHLREGGSRRPAAPGREPLPRDHSGPVVSVLRRRSPRSVFDRGSGQEAHRLTRREPLARRVVSQWIS
jgi:arylsulfatase